MKLSFSDLESLYDLVNEKYLDVRNGNWEAVREEISELHLLMHKLLKLQEGEKKWDKSFYFEPRPTAEPEKEVEFMFSTAEIAKKLKVTDSDLRALRKAKELKEGYHYTTGRSPRPTAIWYDLHRTCDALHGITWTTFSSPGFDVKAHTERRTAQAFEAARRRQKT
tara:strand:- start:729 stop:1226 length:498 start_codon:yes stop_codon:yes gene_type:complete